MRFYTISFLLFCFLKLQSQNYRDRIVVYELTSLLNSRVKMTVDAYQNTKGLVAKLDADYGYEVDLHYQLLKWSYIFEDIEYFKQHLEILTERHGLDAAHFSGLESFYPALFEGELKAWFKPMYLAKHALWQEENFSKLSDLRQLRDLQIREQAVSEYAMKVSSLEEVSPEVRLKLTKIRAESYFAVLADLYKICRKHGVFPTGKNFGVLPGDFSRLVTNNFSTTDNMERSWLLLEPYFKKAYLEHHLDFSFYRSYDIYNFLHHGYQRIGLIERKDVPTPLAEEETMLNSIPVKNAFEANKIKREMGW